MGAVVVSSYVGGDGGDARRTIGRHRIDVNGENMTAENEQKVNGLDCAG